MQDSDPTPVPDQRKAPRSNMFLAAVLHTRDEQAAAKVRNMAPRGAMVESELLPAPGTPVHLIRGGLCAEATVIWRSERQCGLHFTKDVAVKQWLAPPANAEQQRIDQMMTQIRSGQPLPPGMGPAATAPPAVRLSTEQLVDDLGAVYRLIEGLADELADDSDAFARHAVKLQNLDVAMQMLAAIAKELVAPDGPPKVSMARLQDLRVACAQALRSPH